MTVSPSVVASPHRIAGALVIEAGGEARVLILRSAIDGVFSAGVEVAAHAPQGAEAMLDSVPRPGPTRAPFEVRHPGGGGRTVPRRGLRARALCDVVVASPRATFGQPERRPPRFEHR